MQKSGVNEYRSTTCYLNLRARERRRTSHYIQQWYLVTSQIVLHVSSRYLIMFPE